MPVKPDELILHLDAYAKTLPALKALRLCHRFGKGPDVHIIKLPVEVEQIIEAYVVATRRAWEELQFEWCMLEKEFRCFESKCCPSSHHEDNSPMHERAYDEVELCDFCEAEGISEDGCLKKCTKGTVEPCPTCQINMASDDCEKTCEAAYGEVIERLAHGSESTYEYHAECCDGWATRVSPRAFAKHAKVLREHFGLEAFLADTAWYPEPKGGWPEDRNYRWHGSDTIQTTLCYLTLPKTLGPHTVFEPGELDSRMYAECGGSVYAAQALRVDPPGTLSQEERARFQRALKTLGLTPYLHPSQDRQPAVSARLNSPTGQGSGTSMNAWMEEHVTQLTVGQNRRAPPGHSSRYSLRAGEHTRYHSRFRSVKAQRPQSLLDRFAVPLLFV
ncbi:hypothetical protein BAUCODRAFT_72039 [Baudoinia panamericana UAMH 10762]|uniref:Uncharacterized protein n=1 Tax=Baudoinia panamericana (strain UAMH 10762) TaxID=717646 RepID=M2MU54_BAUPA|nr:uncharacterized protein BAUCODRAFT_72039 [Baudoinia panamericana UAMH 10762]EMC95088.1 hypothetical protein BAUCODRAFT_72039 [Baudoinia panamericana UAMH 10762]